jgi:phosphatidylglycerol:prolipoprotein diacylglycerol transferase
LDLNQIDSLITYLIVGVILGGRIGYALFYNFEYYASNPLDVLKVWEGGMSFHGGFLGVILAVTVFFKFHGIPLTSGADLIAFATPPGLFFGRIANFINGELWGHPTNSSFGVIFPGERAQDCPLVYGVCARHPSQLYEAGLEGLLLFFVLILVIRLGALKYPGLVVGTFLIGYSMSRYFVEFFRDADPQFVSVGNPFGYVYQIGDLGIKMGQLLSLPMLLLGIVFIFFSYRLKA